VTIKKTPKPKKAKGAPREKTDLVRCATCGAQKKEAEMRFAMRSFFDPTEHACSIPCYHAWNTKRIDAMGDAIPPQAAARIRAGELG